MHLQPPFESLVNLKDVKLCQKKDGTSSSLRVLLI